MKCNFWKQHIKLFLICSICSYSSCVEDVDFDQSTDVTLPPVLDVSLSFFELTSSDFLSNGEELSPTEDFITNIEIFEQEFVQDNLVKAEVLFKISNSINRRFNIQIDLLDNTTTLQRSIVINVPASINGNTITTQHIEVFDTNSIEELKNTTEFIYAVFLLPSTDGSTLDNNSEGILNLQSSGTFFLNLEI